MWRIDRNSNTIDLNIIFWDKTRKSLGFLATAFSSHWTFPLIISSWWPPTTRLHFVYKITLSWTRTSRAAIDFDAAKRWTSVSSGLSTVMSPVSKWCLRYQIASSLWHRARQYRYARSQDLWNCAWTIYGSIRCMVFSFLLRHIVMRRDAIVNGSVAWRNLQHLHWIHLPTRHQDLEVVMAHGKEERVAKPPKKQKTVLLSPAHLRTTTALGSRKFGMLRHPEEAGVDLGLVHGAGTRESVKLDRDLTASYIMNVKA